MTIGFVLLLIGSIAALGVSFVMFQQSVQERRRLAKREKAMERRMYELAILKELGERIGYSLNIQNIVDIITGSLHQFIEYSAVSYMLLQPEKLIFKVHLERSVSRSFLNDIRVRMQKSLSALLNKDMQQVSVEEILSGAVLVDEVDDPVESFFNIPLVIGDKVVGVLTIADTKPGLYKEEETTILYKITQQASQAVTRLHEVIEIEQRKLSAMVASMTEGVVMTDTDYRVLVANPAVRKIVGIDKTDDVTIFDFIDRLGGHYDIRGRLEESVKLNKNILSDEVVINDRYYQVFVSPVSGNFGFGGVTILGAVVIFHDITHDKELERLREDFTSMIVHELRSPLDGIKLMSQYIHKVKKPKDMKELMDNVGLIQQSSVNMLALVNDLLDVAKLEAGRFEIHPVPTSISDIISDKIKFYQPSAAENKIGLKSVLAPALPTNLQLDPVRIGQVLGNLMSNALKFTPSGGAITIQAFVHEAGQQITQEAAKAGVTWFVRPDEDKLKSIPVSVIVAVTDSGEGIAAKDIPQLFNKFTQLRSRTNRTSEQAGTGLGLVVAKGIVEAHTGVIGAASEEGQGSTFYFTLPLSA